MGSVREEQIVSSHLSMALFVRNVVGFDRFLLASWRCIFEMRLWVQGVRGLLAQWSTGEKRVYSCKNQIFFFKRDVPRLCEEVRNVPTLCSTVTRRTHSRSLIVLCQLFNPRG